jgi:DHA1 family bicyclomycin/chloramphenicol resistance-like MFS transporter
VGEIFHHPELFVYIFGGMGVVMMCSTFLNSKLSARFGARRTIRVLLISYTFIGAIVLLFTCLYGDPPNMIFFFAGVTLQLALNLAVEPNSSALALEPMGEMAGMASSVYGTIFFFIGSTLGSVISSLMVHGIFPLVLSFFVLGLIATILILTDRRPIIKK